MSALQLLLVAYPNSRSSTFLSHPPARPPQLAANASAASAIVVSQLSASIAALVWLAMDAAEHKPTALGLITGAIAGLAAITPAAGVVGVPGALLIGAASAVVCRFCSTAVKAHFKYDDSLDVFGVHGVGGLVGTLLLALAGQPLFGGALPAGSALSQLWTQTWASAVVAAYTLVVSVALLKATAALTGGLRVTALVEAKGLDEEELGETAYAGVPFSTYLEASM